MELWDHQKLAIERARGKPGFALWMEMGTGKTRCSIEILKERYGEKPKKTLIFCPGIVVSQWREEFLKFSKIDPRQIIKLEGTGKRRLETFRKTQAAIYICNHETLLMKDLFKAFQEWSPEFIVYDEAHKFRTHNAKRSVQAYLLSNPKGKDHPITYLLSGTPILNSEQDVFMPLNIMLGEWPASPKPITSFYSFRSRYFEDRNAYMPAHIRFPNWQIRPGSVEEISRILDQTGMRVLKQECLDLPDELTVTIKVGMLAEQARAYHSMKHNLIAYLKESACVASLALTKALRLQQISADFAQLENGEILSFDRTPKEAALQILLEELTPHSKVLLWSCWIQSYKQLAKALTAWGIPFVEVHGEISDVKKKDAVELFQNNPEIKVLLGHPGAAGIGLNLICAPYSIFYSRNFSLEQSLQAKSRNHRAGQTQKIVHYELICENSIDEAILEKLSMKQTIGASLLGDLLK